MEATEMVLCYCNLILGRILGTNICTHSAQTQRLDLEKKNFARNSEDIASFLPPFLPCISVPLIIKGLHDSLSQVI